MRRIVVALSCFLVLALSGVARAATLTVAWDPVAQSDVVGYRVSYGTQPGVYDHDLDAGNATFQVVDNLPQNTTYYFVVRAYAADGRMSAPSIEVQGQTASDNPGSAVLPDAPASPAPQDLAVAPLDAQLAWAPSSNATSYSVAFGTVNPPPVVAIDQAATRYAPGNLVPGTTYFWRVVAKGPGGSTDGPVWRFTTAVNGGATAAFLRTDTATAGSWKNAYGRDGYVLAAGPTSMPGYVALSTAGVPSWTWASSTNDLRALQQPSGADRFAATWYGDNYQFDVNFTDGQPHDLAIYLLDWDSTTRTETIQILDATSGAPLDSRAVSGFNGGQYLVWRVAGHVTVKVTKNVGANAVVEGIFFDGMPSPPPGVPAGPMPAANATNVLTSIALNWAPPSDTQSYDVAFGTTNPPPAISTAQAATSYQPATAMAAGTTYFWRVTAKGPGGTTAGPVWSFTTAPLPSAPSGPMPADAATKVDPSTSMSWAPSQNATEYDVAFGTANPPPVVSSHQTATSYRPAASLASNTTYYWKIVARGVGGTTDGPVWSFTTLASAATTSATFLRVDTTTGGNWKNAYGRDGYAIANDAVSLPAYAVVSQTGQLSWTWAASTTDTRALQKSASADRLAATWYGGSFTMDLNVVDAQAHQVALYALDWDSNARVETIQILDAVTGQLLDSRPASAFHGGQYFIWSVVGHVTIRLTCTGGVNGVLSALFFDTPGAAANTPPSVALTKPVSGASLTAPASVALAAAAADADGSIAQVAFYAGATIVGTVTAPPYEATWTNVAAGSYSITAVATDNAGATTTSSPVQITVAAPQVGTSAAFLGTDLSTRGNWRNTYGTGGYAVANDSSVAASYATVGQTGMMSWTWAASTNDVRALKKGATNGRIASAWYANDAFSIDVTITDGQTHEMSLYLLDWESNARIETIEIVDAAKGTVIESRSASGFNGGQYLTWRISGHVIVRVTRTAGINAAVSGLFFDR